MVREAVLEFVNRLGGDSGGKDAVQLAKRMMKPLEPGYARLDPWTRPSGVVKRAQTRQKEGGRGRSGQA